MRVLTGFAFAAVLAAAQTSFASADTMMSGSMASSNMQAAKCPAGDPAVIVNPAKMTYMMDTGHNREAMKGMMTHDKFVCKSHAMKMGAKMTSSPPSMKKM